MKLETKQKGEDNTKAGDKLANKVQAVGETERQSRRHSRDKLAAKLEDVVGEKV